MAKTYHKLFALSEEKEIIKKDQQTWLKLRSKKVAKINNKTSFIIKLIQLTRARNRYLFQQISALEN
jgi:uncharacterized protein YecT (DUF1311 family)